MAGDIKDDLFSSADSSDNSRRGARKRRRGLKIFIAVLIVFVLILAGIIAAISLYINGLSRDFDNNVTAVPSSSAFPESDRPQDSEGTTILLLGSDQRPQGGGEGGRDGERADSIMLLNIPADGGEVYVMSVLRDTWVDIPGMGEAKINSAYNSGGMPLMVETMESLFGTHIDEVMAVDFEGFEGVTDALGGVTVNVPQDFTSDDGTQFTAGPTEMDGTTALKFVRERYAFTDSDYTRVQNQRAYIRAVLDRFLSADTLTNPGRISDTVETISPYLTVSEGLDSGYIRGLVPKMLGTRHSDIHMFTVHTEGIGTSGDGQSIVLPDHDAMQEIGQAIDDDTLDEYFQQNGDNDGSGL
ncbi:LytR family transcriptional regulator [Kocuria coralli]|uniref:LytR family transcriptional regulator n=1 Tax=Kocuria coralli TaxID=1461025 RepID=A0A5J5KU06_9MICC|nr:LCP family protein [Kocuria coralli]KAA9393084.1 LytR family transcriptional regulator [Kocuria coralli]